MIEPLGDQLIIALPDGGEKNVGGIIIPAGLGENNRAPYRGVVIAAGPGRLSDRDETIVLPVRCAVGDVVLANRFTSTEIIYGGRPCVICRDADIFAVIRPDADVPKKTLDTNSAY